MDCTKRDDETNSRYHEEVMNTRKEQSRIEYDGGTEDKVPFKSKATPSRMVQNASTKRRDGRSEIGTMLDISSG